MPTRRSSGEAEKAPEQRQGFDPAVSHELSEPPTFRLTVHGCRNAGIYESFVNCQIFLKKVLTFPDYVTKINLSTREV